MLTSDLMLTHPYFLKSHLTNKNAKHLQLLQCEAAFLYLLL